MDELDRKLLNIIQTEFPISSRPFKQIGERIGLEECEIIERVKVLTDSEAVRKIGVSFDSRRLGHVSALVAAKVPDGKLEKVAEIVNSFPEVTHNYERGHEYNLWFTLICGNSKHLEKTFDTIKTITEISDMRQLPAERNFKIKVDFKF